MTKQTRSTAQPQSLGQKIYSQDTETGDWQETAQMPTSAAIYILTLYGCACTPGLLSVSLPRHDACLQLDTGLLVFGAHTPESAKCGEGT